MENLSMSGETEMEDYDDLKIGLESQAMLDQELQDQITTTLLDYQDKAKNIDLTEFKKQTEVEKYGEHYRCSEFVPSRKQDMIAKNLTIRHRNKLVRQARENGKFYLEGGVLSQNQEKMFQFDQEVLR